MVQIGQGARYVQQIMRLRQTWSSSCRRLRQSYLTYVGLCATVMHANCLFPAHRIL